MIAGTASIQTDFFSNLLDLCVLFGIMPARMSRNGPNIWKQCMTDKPIHFVDTMVRALLSGRKSQARRAITKAAAQRELDELGEEFLCRRKNHELLPINVVPGDRLWVREAWQPMALWGRSTLRPPGSTNPVMYRADSITGEPQYWAYTGEPVVRDEYRLPKFMPRWASRVTLTVTDVRVQRLQDISKEDAVAEGVDFGAEPGNQIFRGWWDYSNTPQIQRYFSDPRQAFRSLWESVHGKRAPWSLNPWVAAYSFAVENGNIDHVDIGAAQKRRKTS